MISYLTPLPTPGVGKGCHPDYRNHAGSSKDPESDLNFRLGYTEDVVNAINAVKAASLPCINKEKIGMLGHSMGGGVTLNVLETKPDLVKAATLFAPVSAVATDNFEKYTTRRPELAKQLFERYGKPTENLEFWNNISPVTFLSRIQTPILIHHGTVDDSTPLERSERLNTKLKENNKEVTLHVYPGEPHEFTTAWPTVI